MVLRHLRLLGGNYVTFIEELKPFKIKIILIKLETSESRSKVCRIEALCRDSKIQELKKLQVGKLIYCLKLRGINKMFNLKKVWLIALFLVFSSVVFAAEDSNTGRILEIGKVGSTACHIKLENATFPNTCTTAIYEIIYFDCTTAEGKAFLSISLSAYMASKSVNIVSTSCATQYGSSIANMTSLFLK